MFRKLSKLFDFWVVERSIRAQTAARCRGRVDPGRADLRHRRRGPVGVRAGPVPRRELLRGLRQRGAQGLQEPGV
eukprot:1639168-Pyramimonas_sp.AAC.2